MKILQRIAIALCCVAITLTASAEDTPWYQVEILVFANEDPSVLDDEFWPQGLDVTPQRNAVKLRPPMHTGQSAFDAYELLPTSSLLFNEEKKRIARYHSYRVLYHAGWLQPIGEKSNARPIHIRAGQMLDNGMYELEGYITLDRGRYLHFRPDLYHSRKLSQTESEMLRSFLNAGEKPATEGAVNTQAAEIAAEQSVAPLSPISTSFLEVPEFLTVNMRQGRRMRSEEVHYLDHPLMGILVLMLPVDTADSSVKR
ncbi:CsiV family protein [Pontibacterium granulatum]|uniref:CsiV family protein n=1 Tax=Pontibacterium granulatum TaxID=2036029 RepID=UPI00249C1F36|nr:CsiV family protein [Pontibacterium granulatum]MDI3326074.1 CsiV family protein [Pontibacterium granulatum]